MLTWARPLQRAPPRNRGDRKSGNAAIPGYNPPQAALPLLAQAPLQQGYQQVPQPQQFAQQYAEPQCVPRRASRIQFLCACRTTIKLNSRADPHVHILASYAARLPVRRRPQYAPSGPQYTQAPGSPRYAVAPARGVFGLFRMLITFFMLGALARTCRRATTQPHWQRAVRSK